MKATRYRGFRIQSRPYLIQSGEWAVDLAVLRGGRRTPYTFDAHFGTEAEALERGLGAGRRIIDSRGLGTADSLGQYGFFGSVHFGRRHLLSQAGEALLAVSAFVLVAVVAIALLSGAFVIPWPLASK